MRLEGRGGDTANPMIWVHAGGGNHPMGFHVSQRIWDYVETHPLDLRYNRKFVQAQLDNIQTLLDAPRPAPSAPATVGLPSRSGSGSTLGWTLTVLAAAAAAGALAVGLRRATHRRPATEPSPLAVVPVEERPELVDGAEPSSGPSLSR